MLKTGMIIAERYEIVGKIGTGGMADETGISGGHHVHQEIQK